MDFEFNRLLAHAARQVASEGPTSTTLDRVVQLCTEAVDRCTMAAVTIVDNDGVRTLAASDPSARLADELYVTLGEGPLAAVRSHETVVSNDLGLDQRWPRWGPAVVSATGIRALLSYQVAVQPRSLAALHLYSDESGAFQHEDVFEGQAMAAHASYAVAVALKEQQFDRALRSRTVIGQATGILIERFGLDAEQAFAVMRRMSQQHNIKLHTMALHLVETGVLLEGDQSPVVEDSQGDPAPA